MSRILITGGDGFVGRHLVAALAARDPDCEIIVGALSAGAPPHGGKWRNVELDITDADRVTRSSKRNSRRISFIWRRSRPCPPRNATCGGPGR